MNNSIASMRSSSTRRRHFAGAGAKVIAIVAIGTLAGMAAFAAPAGAAGSLHLKPHTLKFEVVSVPGGPCPGSGCDYAEATVVNGTATSQDLKGGTTASGAFWITWGGTCNVADAYVIPAHKKCTVQFGFDPTAANTSYTSTGTLDFANGVQLSLGLKGRSA